MRSGARFDAGIRRRAVFVVLSCALAGILLAACGSSSGSPEATVGAYLAAWGRRDWAAMRQLVKRPPADFSSTNAAAISDLTVRRARYTAGQIRTGSSSASAPLTGRLEVAGIGTITLHSSIHLVLDGGRWLVDWSPATIAPGMGPGRNLTLDLDWPARAPILGSDGARSPPTRRWSRSAWRAAW